MTSSHIHITNLPKNTTFASEPFHLGIIWCVKANYKRNLMAFMEMKTKEVALKKQHLAAVAKGVSTHEPLPFKACMQSAA